VTWNCKPRGLQIVLISFGYLDIVDDSDLVGHEDCCCGDIWDIWNEDEDEEEDFDNDDKVDEEDKNCGGDIWDI
jgi:hypothetical protein